MKNYLYISVLAWFLLIPAASKAQDIELVKSGCGGPRYFTNVNGILYFAAIDATHGYELWRSDGTEAGTWLVKDIFAGSEGSDPEYITNVNGTLYFVASHGDYGRELWKSDGTEAGTRLVKDLIEGSEHSNPMHLANLNGKLYFSGNDGIHGHEIWESDGTAAGTVMVADIWQPIDQYGNPIEGYYVGSSPRYLTNVNGTLFFSAGGLIPIIMV